jgi:FtsP/CotA-like multicopper oxidase with cupredoxin domain
VNHDRRTFFGIGGGALLCSLAGENALSGDKEVDLDGLAAKVKDPPSLRSVKANARQAQLPTPAPGGRRIEVWLQAERASWTIVPTKRDEMMDEKVKGSTRFTALVYRLYNNDWAFPVGPPSMPGPLLEAEVGDTLVVNFRNRTGAPVTVHPHGVFYTADMDGAYKGKFTQPGGFVKPGKTFQYVWDCRPGTEGVWPYHDHGPLDPLPLYKGLFGLIHVRPRDTPRADVDHYIVLHSLIPSATGLVKPYQCINGRAYAGNTPELRARVGQRVAQHVVGMSNDFHTYHLHGHRWTEADGTVVDNVTVGPADSYSLEFTEDNPGRWFYHCHVFSHLHEGMNGWYVVDP